MFLQSLFITSCQLLLQEWDSPHVLKEGGLINGSCSDWPALLIPAVDEQMWASINSYSFWFFCVISDQINVRGTNHLPLWRGGGCPEKVTSDQKAESETCFGTLLGLNLEKAKTNRWTSLKIPSPCFKIVFMLGSTHINQHKDKLLWNYKIRCDRVNQRILVN